MWDCPRRPPSTQRAETNHKVIIDVSSLKLQNEFAAILSPGRIEKPSEPGAGEVVLHVARIEVIKQVEYAPAHTSGHAFAQKVQVDSAGHLDIAGGKVWETVDVARPDVFAELVLDRIWKSSMKVVNRNNRESPRTGNRTPQQEAVRCVEWQPPASVRLD